MRLAYATLLAAATLLVAGPAAAQVGRFGTRLPDIAITGRVELGCGLTKGAVVATVTNTTGYPIAANTLITVDVYRAQRHEGTSFGTPALAPGGAVRVSVPDGDYCRAWFIRPLTLAPSF